MATRDGVLYSNRIHSRRISLWSMQMRAQTCIRAVPLLEMYLDESLLMQTDVSMWRRHSPEDKRLQIAALCRSPCNNIVPVLLVGCHDNASVKQSFHDVSFIVSFLLKTLNFVTRLNCNARAGQVQSA